MASSLYRYFDVDGRLLYVGVSLSAIDRMRDHAALSAWFHNVARMTVVKYASREEALAAEKGAIQNERPIHNALWNSEVRAAQKTSRHTKGEGEIEKRIELARQAVKERTGQHRAIAAALEVHYNWVRKFASGALVEPGAIKFAHLEDWLTKN